MARIHLKLWQAPLAVLQSATPAGLSEGEIAISSETNTLYKRPDGEPTGELIVVGMPPLGPGLIIDAETGQLTVDPSLLFSDETADQMRAAPIKVTNLNLTGNFILTLDHAGRSMSTRLATGPITLQLPSANLALGCEYEILKLSEFNVSFKAVGTDVIMDSPAAGTLTNSVIIEKMHSVRVRAAQISADHYAWLIVAGFGSWTTA